MILSLARAPRACRVGTTFASFARMELECVSFSVPSSKGLPPHSGVKLTPKQQQRNDEKVASSGGGAWFLAVSKEHNLAKNHMIVPNGYDLGRDELVEIAVNPNGTRSPVSQTLYRATVRAVGGREYFGAVGPNEINHGVGIDGRIAVLTVTVAEDGNGRTAQVFFLFHYRSSSGGRRAAYAL